MLIDLPARKKTMTGILKKTLDYVRRKLRRPLPPDFMNFDHNRALWNRYARTWRKEEIPLQNPDIDDRERDCACP